MAPLNRMKYGEIPGFPAGSTFASREELIASRLHSSPEKGIDGTAAKGARSIVLNGKYEDDDDQGDIIIYAGAGGRDKAGPQTSDQTLKHPNNRPLLTSLENEQPVRVIRGSELKSIYAPQTGYRYDGLYKVIDAREEKGKSGFIVCLFVLERRRLPAYSSTRQSVPRP